MNPLRYILLITAAVALTAGMTAAQFGGSGASGTRGGGSRGGTRDSPGGIDLRLQQLQQQQANPLDSLQELLGGGNSFRSRGGGGGRRGYGGDYISGNEPLDLPLERNGIAEWQNDPQFKTDLFTLVRLRYTTATRYSGYNNGGTGGTGKSWLNDWPDGDMNLSFRLAQMTSMKVNPVPLRMQIYDERLADYPFALMNQIGGLEFTEREVIALRKYLLNGGFLMVDDHWGENDQRNWAAQIRRVFPDRKPVELTIDHPIFHCVFDFKKLPQIPTLQLWLRDARSGNPEETSRPPNYPPPVYRAIYDDHGRMMVLEDANTDTTDGWQREAENEEYFHRFSEKTAFPWAINVIFYALTH